MSNTRLIIIGTALTAAAMGSYWIYLPGFGGHAPLYAKIIGMSLFFGMWLCLYFPALYQKIRSGR